MNAHEDDEEELALEIAQRLARQPEALLPLVEALPEPEATEALKGMLPVMLRHYGRLLRAVRAGGGER